MATRFYFRASATPDVSPSFTLPSSGFTETNEAIRRKMLISKLASDSLTTTSATLAGTSGSELFLQGVSDPMNSGLTFDTGVSYLGQFKVSESAANDNITCNAAILIVSEDGNTVRHTVKGRSALGPSTEFNPTTLRNKQFFSVAGDGSYTTVAGDRLVAFIGYATGAGTSMSGTLQYGSDSALSDLTSGDETETGNLLGWFETSLNITFDVPDAGPPHLFDDRRRYRRSLIRF